MVLVAIDTNGSDSADFALPQAPILSPVTGLRLEFEFPVSLQASDLQLIEAGPDGWIETRYCAQQPSGDDQHVALRALRHGDPASEVAADFGPPGGLAAGAYRFLLCEQVSAPTRRHDFTVAETGRLANPNFSSGLDGWQFGAVPGAGPQPSHSNLDADGSTVSGALRVDGAARSALVLYSESCVQDLRGANRLRLKHRVLQGEVQIRMTVVAGFAGDQGDAPCVGPVVYRHSLGEASGPAAAYRALDSGLLPALPAPAAMVVIELWGVGDTPFAVLLDDIGFSSNPSTVFHSNFD